MEKQKVIEYEAGPKRPLRKGFWAFDRAMNRLFSFLNPPPFKESRSEYLEHINEKSNGD